MKISTSIILLTITLLLCNTVEATLAIKRGPQARVAVAKFGANDRFASVYGGWNIGGGLSAQVVTELIRSDRVVVVERAILSKVLIEQELGQAKLSSPFTHIPAGQLLGVDYLIVGEVTEFEEKQVGGGAGLSVMKGFGPRISGDAVAAFVGIDLRVVDTRTGEILHSHRAQGRAWDKAVGTKIDYKFIEFGGELFHKTPLGKATRRAIEDSLNFILEVIEKRIADFSWTARIIEVEGNDIYLDVGLNQDITPGHLFEISTVKKVLTDPETNEVLGLVENRLGRAKAIDVQPKYTRAKLTGRFKPEIGDLARMVSRTKQQPIKPTQFGYEIME